MHCFRVCVRCESSIYTTNHLPANQPASQRNAEKKHAVSFAMCGAWHENIPLGPLSHSFALYLSSFRLLFFYFPAEWPTHGDNFMLFIALLFPLFPLSFISILFFYFILSRCLFLSCMLKHFTSTTPAAAAAVFTIFLNDTFIVLLFHCFRSLVQHTEMCVLCIVLRLTNHVKSVSISFRSSSFFYSISTENGNYKSIIKTGIGSIYTKI